MPSGKYKIGYQEKYGLLHLSPLYLQPDSQRSG